MVVPQKAGEVRPAGLAHVGVGQHHDVQASQRGLDCLGRPGMDLVVQRGTLRVLGEAWFGRHERANRLRAVLCGLNKTLPCHVGVSIKAALEGAAAARTGPQRRQSSTKASSRLALTVGSMTMTSKAAATSSKPAAVSYTHLTLPTHYSVYISVVSVS